MATHSEPDLVAEVASGDRRRALVALRNRLAQELTVAEGRNVAAIAGQLQKVLDAIDALPDETEKSNVVDFAARVADKRAQASGL